MPKKLSKKIKFQTLRGMKDILPESQKYWDIIRDNIDKLMKDYRYGRIDLPILEDANLFIRGIGKQTDIVEKEMFSFIDQGGDNVTLRPEPTAGIARAYVEHGMLSMPQPVKLYCLGPMFRREKPQSGRQRQFYQFGCEVLGGADSIIDSQLINICYQFFKKLNIEVTTQINSIGCPECRAGYIKTLIAYYKNKKASICENCRKRLTKNPLRLLDCKEKKCQIFKESAPQILDWLCEDCRTHFEQVLEYLDGMEIPYSLNPLLVRGLDYYNKTVFEFYEANESEERQNALGGGGRYDYLIQLLGGQPTPAVGFGIGIERVIAKIRDNGLKISEPKYDIFIAQLGVPAKCQAMALFDQMRLAGISVAENFHKDSLKSQLEIANKLKVKYTIIIGQKEVIGETVLLRNMEGGVQEIINYKKIIDDVKKRLGQR
ncbi:MAG: histidine--tRNA ligase [bacterium]